MAVGGFTTKWLDNPIAGTGESIPLLGGDSGGSSLAPPALDVPVQRLAHRIQKSPAEGEFQNPIPQIRHRTSGWGLLLKITRVEVLFGAGVPKLDFADNFG